MNQPYDPTKKETKIYFEYEPRYTSAEILVIEYEHDFSLREARHQFDRWIERLR